MEVAVQVVWWVGLLAALALTLVALKLLLLLLRTLRHLRELAASTADAAGGMAEALAGPLGLEDAADSADGLRRGALSLRDSSRRIRAAVGAAAPRERADGLQEGPPGGPGAGELGGAAGGPANESGGGP